MTEPPNPWQGTSASAAGVGGTTASIHAPSSQAFQSSPTQFRLASGASHQHPLTTIREQDDDDDVSLDNYSETRGRRFSSRADKRPEDDEDDINPDDDTNTKLLKILQHQTEINKQLASKGAILPVQLPFFHGKANENVQTWLF